MPEEAFVTGEQAARLFSSGKRKVLVLSYGWLCSSEADPDGARLEVVCRYLLTLDDANECAVFIDQVCLPQPPRTAEEDAIFLLGLNKMGSLYASVRGTTVIQIKAIPPRPAAFDGRVARRRRGAAGGRPTAH